jgi:hypothetical protein
VDEHLNTSKANRQHSLACPGAGDAEFLGRWLLSAVEADQVLIEQFKGNPDLRQQISSLETAYIFSFAPTAMKCVELLMKNLTCFTLSTFDEWIEVFAVMAELGFFRLTGNRYQMTLPPTIRGSEVQSALLRLAATEDQEYYLHPEHLVTCLDKAEVQAWQQKLEALPWMQREAKRNLLLAGN